MIETETNNLFCERIALVPLGGEAMIEMFDDLIGHHQCIGGSFVRSTMQRETIGTIGVRY